MLTIHTAAKLSDPQVLAGAMRLAAEGRKVVADLIALLLAVDARRLYAEEGYSSLFRFCVERLRLSEEEAYYRIAAARVAARFPVVLDRLREGRLTLTAVAVLRKHLTEANHAEILQGAEGRSKREVQGLVAAVAPRADVPTSLRKLSALETRVAGPAATIATEAERQPVAPLLAHPVSPQVSMPSSLGDLELFDHAPTGPAFGAAPAMPARAVDGNDAAVARENAFTTAPLSEPIGGAPDMSSPATIIPLAPVRYSLRVTIGEETYRKLRRAQNLLAHRVAAGDTAAVLDRALTLLVEQLERQKFGAQAARHVRSETRTAAHRHPVAGHRKERPSATHTEPDATTTGPPRTPVVATPDRAGLAAEAGERGPQPPASPVTGSLESGARHRSRYIPAAVRREVWLRDEGQCRYVSPTGRQCGATARLDTTTRFLLRREANRRRRTWSCDVPRTRARRPAAGWGRGHSVSGAPTLGAGAGWQQVPAVGAGLALVNTCRRSGSESG